MNRIVIPATDVRALRGLQSAKLAEELDRADIVPLEHVPDDVVTMHARVRYLDETTGDTREVMLVYPDEADASQGRISVLSPVGAALLGLAAGQSIEWDFPNGPRRLRVEDVRQPARDAQAASA
jgi:regulator of nucleoside diphosphate kinase